MTLPTDDQALDAKWCVVYSSRTFTAVMGNFLEILHALLALPDQNGKDAAIRAFYKTQNALLMNMTCVPIGDLQEFQQALVRKQEPKEAPHATD